MADATKNLTIARGENTVWDKPGVGTRLSELDQERWMAVGGGSLIAMMGARRGGMLGGLMAAGGLALAVRAAMGHRDVAVARSWIEDALEAYGWKSPDVVHESSSESFPASDSPSWTSTTAGARTTR